MSKTFEDVLDKANSLARASHKRLNSLAYSPATDSWTAYYSDAAGSSYVEIRDVDSYTLLNEIDSNYSSSNWLWRWLKQWIGRE